MEALEVPPVSRLKLLVAGLSSLSLVSDAGSSFILLVSQQLVAFKTVSDLKSAKEQEQVNDCVKKRLHLIYRSLV